MQQVWRKRWMSTGWIALGAITLVLLVSAIHKKNHKVCTGIEVSFNGDGNNFFIDEKGVIAELKTYGIIKGAPIESINLRVLEDRLKAEKWIESADLFFDNKQILQVVVQEREPVARIFTVDGSSFYIDSSCTRLPLSVKLSARVPMFTSFPSNREFLSRPDSELLANAKDLAVFVQSDDFWKAQVSQVDITSDGFEMIPTVGSHVVKLGKKGEWKPKFDRLYSFYKQVWTKVGFERYEKLDVQFDGQVVATVKGGKSSIIDTVKAKAAFQNLLNESQPIDKDTVTAAPAPATVMDTVPPTEAAARPVAVSVARTNATPVKAHVGRPDTKKPVARAETRKPVQARPAVARRATARPKPQPVKTDQAALAAQGEEKKVPKAVMRRRPAVPPKKGR